MNYTIYAIFSCLFTLAGVASIYCVVRYDRHLAVAQAKIDDLQNAYRDAVDEMERMDEAHAHTQEDLSELINEHASLLTKDEYNGWQNRETWAFVLHIDNDSYHHARACGEAHRLVRDLDLDKVTIDEGLTIGEKRLLGFVFTDDFFEFLDDVPESEPMGMRQDVGSIWRINHVDIGEWVWQLYNTTEVPDEYILP